MSKRLETILKVGILIGAALDAFLLGAAYSLVR